MGTAEAERWSVTQAPLNNLPRALHIALRTEFPLGPPDAALRGLRALRCPSEGLLLRLRFTLHRLPPASLCVAGEISQSQCELKQDMRNGKEKKEIVNDPNFFPDSGFYFPKCRD